jgi:hypothetical protein
MFQVDVIFPGSAVCFSRTRIDEEIPVVDGLIVRKVFVV